MSKNIVQNSFVYNFDFARSLEQIRCENMLFSDRCLRPDRVQSISNIRRFVESIATHQHKQLELGAAESIILLGLDSIKYDYAMRTFSPSWILPLTSVFPSTSVCAWTSAFTGAPAEISRMVSPIFYAAEIRDMYITLNDSYGHEGSWKFDEKGVKRFPVHRLDNIFTDMNRIGYETVCINGVYASTISRWSQALLKDAERVAVSISDWDSIEMNPGNIVDTIIDDIQHAIAFRDPSRRLFAWYLVNLDSYIHVHGYSNELTGALKKLDVFINELASAGHLVISFADHGQTRQKYSGLTDQWNRLIGSKYCRHQAGGAGRARWCYPKAKYESLVFEETKDLFGESAIVFHRDELGDHGLLEVGPNLQCQVGEILALAVAEEFPLAVYGEGFTFEHGSVSYDEMCVPLMIWDGR